MTGIQQKSPLVSVVTVSYNSERTIRDTIESVLRQTYDNIEYIIIDGVSKDNTVDIARNYEGAFADRGYKYRIISEPDSGIYDAMNKGIRLAEGELIGLINSDDWFEDGTVKKIVESYLQTDYELCFGSVRSWKGEASYIKKSRNRKFKTSRDFCHPGMFVRKNTYLEIGAYDEEYFYADFDFWLRAYRKGKKIEVLGDVLANFRIGGVSNEKNLKKAIMRFKDRYAVYKNNGYSKLYIVECFFMELAKFILA